MKAYKALLVSAVFTVGTLFSAAWAQCPGPGCPSPKAKEYAPVDNAEVYAPAAKADEYTPAKAEVRSKSKSALKKTTKKKQSAAEKSEANIPKKDSTKSTQKPSDEIK